MTRDFDRFDQRISAYLDREITPEAFDRLCEDLAGDPSLRRRFLKLSALDLAISHTADQQDRHNTIASVLANDEPEPETDSVFTLYQSIEPKVQNQSSPSIRWGDVLPLLGYTARLALRDARVVRGLGAAALLVVGVLLTIALIGPSDETEPTPLANEGVPAADGSATNPELISVASLTDERDAEWVRRPGQDLFAGQRFTLTQGFAEITTARGAVAILEAPATVEFTDSDNALRLHTGKLVGICETVSSKGFVVHALDARIIDIGTEFGVAVTDQAVTATVFAGDIVLATPGHKPLPITANQTASLASDRNAMLIVEDRLADGFDKLLPQIALSRSIRNDPAMIAYYGFEQGDIVDGRLLNRAAATLGKMDGVLGQSGRNNSQPSLTDGRRPGTHALRFEANEFDVVRIPASDAQALDGLEQFTIGLWVRPDNTDQYSHHLLTWREQNQDAINLVAVWNGSPQALADGAVPDAALFNTSQITSQINTHQSSAGSLRRERLWMHLVVTFDRGECSIYLDGKQIAGLASSGPQAIVGLNEELLIGAGKRRLNTPQSYLDGDVDELFILGRAMSAEEISNLYEKEANQP